MWGGCGGLVLVHRAWSPYAVDKHKKAPARPLRRPLSLRYAQSLLLDLNWPLHITTSRSIQRMENLDSTILMQAQSLTTPLNLVVQQQRPENLQGQP